LSALSSFRTVVVVTSVRERVRRELTGEILAAARRQLGEVGPADLSLRAVARELGMASSAVYRYVPSRDELLTLLILAAYDDLGEAAERAEAAVPREDRAGRWTAVGQAARAWALANPHEFALVYGTPVPGYVAPERTIEAATRIPRLLIALLRDVVAAGAPEPPVPPESPPAAYPDLLAAMGPDVPPARAVLGMAAWTWLVGRIGFELHGHLVGIVDPARADEAYLWECTAVRTSFGLT
jgi:AcrR family transcriptional regulator